MVSEFAYPVLGGVSEHVHFLSRELARLGHEVTVVTARLGKAFPEAGGVDREAERLHGYRTVRVGRSLTLEMNGSVARVSAGLGVKRAVARALAGADVVHAQGLAAPLLPLFALRVSTAPVTVGTFHTWFPEGSYQKHYRAWSPYVGNALSRLDRWIAVSQACIDTFDPLFPGHWTIIPNGVDCDAFRPLAADEAAPAGPPRILFVGRLEPRNALDTLLDAAALLRGQGRDIVVQVVGDGPGRAQYEAQARALGIEDRVEWLGAQLEERPRLYREAAVFAAPCTTASFGVVLIEAAASGTPIVWADNVGFRTVMRDGMPGHRVPPNDAAAMAEGIALLLDDPATRRAWGVRGRAVCEERFAWPQVAARVVALYEEILHERGPARTRPVRPFRRHPGRG